MYVCVWFFYFLSVESLAQALQVVQELQQGQKQSRAATSPPRNIHNLDLSQSSIYSPGQNTGQNTHSSKRSPGARGYYHEDTGHANTPDVRSGNKTHSSSASPGADAHEHHHSARGEGVERRNSVQMLASFLGGPIPPGPTQENQLPSMNNNHSTSPGLDTVKKQAQNSPSVKSADQRFAVRRGTQESGKKLPSILNTTVHGSRILHKETSDEHVNEAAVGVVVPADGVVVRGERNPEIVPNLDQDACDDKNEGVMVVGPNLDNGGRIRVDSTGTNSSVEYHSNSSYDDGHGHDHGHEHGKDTDDADVTGVDHNDAMHNISSIDGDESIVENDAHVHGSDNPNSDGIDENSNLVHADHTETSVETQQRADSDEDEDESVHTTEVASMHVKVDSDEDESVHTTEVASMHVQVDSLRARHAAGGVHFADEESHGHDEESHGHDEESHAHDEEGRAHSRRVHHASLQHHSSAKDTEYQLEKDYDDVRDGGARDVNRTQNLDSNESEHDRRMHTSPANPAQQLRMRMSTSQSESNNATSRSASDGKAVYPTRRTSLALGNIPRHVPARVEMMPMTSNTLLKRSSPSPLPGRSMLSMHAGRISPELLDVSYTNPMPGRVSLSGHIGRISAEVLHQSLNGPGSHKSRSGRVVTFSSAQPTRRGGTPDPMRSSRGSPKRTDGKGTPDLTMMGRRSAPELLLAGAGSFAPNRIGGRAATASPVIRRAATASPVNGRATPDVFGRISTPVPAILPARNATAHSRHSRGGFAGVLTASVSSQRYGGRVSPVGDNSDSGSWRSKMGGSRSAEPLRTSAEA
jgi:hypothetical protein